MRHTITTLAVILALVGPPAAATQMGPNVESAEPFKLGTFQNEAGLEAMGDNLYLETPASGSPITGSPGDTGFGTILQGFLETANVNAVEEISQLISAQRAYEMNSKVIQTSDEMMGTLTSLR